MKEFEKMAEAVFEKAEKILYRRRKIRNIAVLTGMVCCLSLLIGVAALQPREQAGNEDSMLQQPTETQPGSEIPIMPTSPTDSVVSMEGITLLAATSPDDAGTPMEADLTLPLNYYLMVRDLLGLTKAERDEIVELERLMCEQKMSLEGGYSLSRCLLRQNYVISLVRNGGFRLKIDDYTAVEQITVKSMTMYGWVDVALSDSTFPKGQSVTLNPTDIPQRDQEIGLRINWKYNSLLLDVLEADPSYIFNGFSDTVQFAVDYKDGSRQEFSVSITVQPDGQVMACLIGNNAKM